MSSDLAWKKMDADENNGTDLRDDADEVEIKQTMEKFGKYQMIQYLCTCLATIFITITHINYVFVAGELKYRCRIPECDRDNGVYNETWWPTNAVDRCNRPLLKQQTKQTCSNDSFTDTFEVCTEWIYESNDTLIAEFNLACQPWKSNMIGMIHSLGMLFGAVSSGWIADRIGRKPIMIFCFVGSSVGHLKAFISSFHVFIFIEFLEAVITGGTYTVVIVLMIEICGKKKRLLAILFFSYSIYMGETVLSVLAMFIPYWKDLIRIIYSPSFAFLSFIFLMKESPRWQILNGKVEDAKSTLLYIAKLNRVNINKDKLSTMDKDNLKKEFEMENHEQIEIGKSAFKSKEIVKRLFVAAFSRFSASFIYYGLMVNTVYLTGDKYTNFMMSSLMSYPGETVFMIVMHKVGRRMPLIYGYILCSLVCIASVCVPEDVTWLKTTFFLIGKMVVSGCFSGIVIYSTELFPTQVRGTLIGICALTSSVGNVLAPLTPILNTVSISLPLICFGILAAISGILLFYTPETKDLPLMDTIEQVENNVKKKTNKERRKVHGIDNEGFNKNRVV